MSIGAERIAAERQRQIEVEGYTPEHDAGHAEGLRRAAQEYLVVGDYQVRYPTEEVDRDAYLDIVDLYGFPASNWPWSRDDFKPGATAIDTLIKAGALIAAEIDRLIAESER